MRPQVQQRDAIGRGQQQRNVAVTLARELQPGRFDAAQRQVEGETEHDADAHDDAPVGDRIDRGARAQPGEQRHHAERGQHQRQQHDHGAGGVAEAAAVGDDEAGAQREDDREVERQRAHVEALACQLLPVRATLPEQGFVGRQPLRQAGRGFELVFVAVVADRAQAAHSRGSLREASAYSVPPP